MRSFLEKYGALLAGALFAWSGWSGLEEDGGAPPEERPRLPAILVADAETREDASSPVPTADPFQADWAPYGPEPEPVQAAAPPAVEDDPPPEPVAVDPAPRAAPAVSSFTLRLDSVVGGGAAGGVARLNGHTVAVGEAVPGLDGEAPPVLVRVDGAAVELEHRGRTLRLHIIDRPVLVVTHGGDR